jgi:hypothetical protein
MKKLVLVVEGGLVLLQPPHLGQKLHAQQHRPVGLIRHPELGAA